MDDVNRWDFDLRDGLRIVDNGDWVRHDDHEYAMGKAAAALAEAQAEIARLRGALEPFAEAAEECDDYRHDDDDQAPVTAGQCRDARAALEAKHG